ncbi:MAG TPA: tripartite tricarboxylate transporter substrate binding protein [Ramlibacter sp.]|nr:tripartite tricarboxylate transporter substrate binding protein [Ramlibacter sp.]
MSDPTRRRLLAAAAAAPLASFVTAPALAQAWPARPIRLIVTFAAGGGADFAGRNVGAVLAQQLGQSVVVENRAGGGGLIGNEAVAKAAPDGYTLLLGAAGPLTVAPHLYAKVPYDPVKDLVPVAHIASTPFVLTVNPGIPANTVAEFTALVKSQPGKLTYGSSGTGGAPHLAGELFCRMAGINMVHAPYKGLGPAITDLMGNHIQVLFADTGLVLPHIKAGKFKAIAATGAQRTPLLPEVPTVREAGLPAYQAGSWYGILAPAGTPTDVQLRINAEMAKALANPELQKQLGTQGMEPAAMTREQFAAMWREDYDKWGKLIKEAGIKVE